jgi:hypothetical protein
MDDRLNASIRHIERPKRLRWQPISDTGYPVPWFVAWIDGKPDFRIADGEKRVRALRRDLCWLCGQTLGRHKAFVLGPMCAINRTTVEPPCHRECAEYSIKACPFLTKPRMRRNDVDRPTEAVEPGGVMIMRNPGCTLLWMTRTYRIFHADGGDLIKIGEPNEIVAYAEGRLATRDELNASITSGLPLLAEAAAHDGPEGMSELNQRIAQADAMFKQLMPMMRAA